ncbi:hypothetical protein OIU85_000462 [Salix viminalis]|uniref:Uncharacterized protein n=1 Tax=Salix viminalis TaxID=40686 RepID=A0A9Q0ZX66_SALVM|nr:hypothetical protein OIU85_000462 [Salix viminalis]
MTSKYMVIDVNNSELLLSPSHHCNIQNISEGISLVHLALIVKNVFITQPLVLLHRECYRLPNEQQESLARSLPQWLKLSLSSSASSGGAKDQWEKEGAEFIRKGVEELQDEPSLEGDIDTVDNSNENPFSFDVQSLASERSEDDVLLSDSNENNSTEIPATWVFEANGETWKSSSNGLRKQPQIGLFSPSLQVNSGIPAKDGGGRGIGDSEVDTAKTSDYEENQLIRRKLWLSKKQSHA